MENNERKNNSLTELMEASMSKIRDMVDSNTIIGEPIQTPDGVTLIPISRVSFGFGSGGGDLPSSQKELFGGGTGGGVTITPMAFLIVRNGDVKLIQVQSYNNTADRLVGMVPDVMDTVSGLISGGKKEKPAEEE